jgi:hypothetical protein
MYCPQENGRQDFVTSERSMNLQNLFSRPFQWQGQHGSSSSQPIPCGSYGIHVVHCHQMIHFDQAIHPFAPLVAFICYKHAWWTRRPTFCGPMQSTYRRTRVANDLSTETTVMHWCRRKTGKLCVTGIVFARVMRHLVLTVLVRHQVWFGFVVEIDI